jgi:hypothetical protein
MRLIGFHYWRGRIDWSRNPDGLHCGDVSQLDPEVAAALLGVANLPEVVALASAIGASRIEDVVALVARADADRDRNAARIARARLGSGDAALVDAAAHALGLWRIRGEWLSRSHWPLKPRR